MTPVIVQIVKYIRVNEWIDQLIWIIPPLVELAHWDQSVSVEIVQRVCSTQLEAWHCDSPAPQRLHVETSTSELSLQRREACPRPGEPFSLWITKRTIGVNIIIIVIVLSDIWRIHIVNVSYFGKTNLESFLFGEHQLMLNVELLLLPHHDIIKSIHPDHCEAQRGGGNWQNPLSDRRTFLFILASVVAVVVVVVLLCENRLDGYNSMLDVGRHHLTLTKFKRRQRTENVTWFPELCLYVLCAISHENTSP